jgi:outer membrane lipoprotein-sorting protein
MKPSPLTSLLLLFFATQIYAGDDPATRYAAMRSVLAKTKSLKVGFESELQGDSGKVVVKGSMILAEGNRARVQMAYELGGKAIEVLIISDGKTTRTISGDKVRDKPTDPNLRDNMLALIERAGFAVTMFTIPVAKDREPDLTKLLTVSDHQAKAADKGVHLATYRLRVADKVLFKVDLSTDDKTHVPLRRVLEVEKGADPVVVRETYAVELEPMTPEELFAVKNDR